MRYPGFLRLLKRTVVSSKRGLHRNEYAENYRKDFRLVGGIIIRNDLIFIRKVR